MSCKNCTSRRLGCHDTCLDYLTYKMNRLNVQINREIANRDNKPVKRTFKKNMWSTHKDRRCKVNE